MIPLRVRAVLWSLCVLTSCQGARNVNACETYVDSQSCAGIDLSQSFPCEPYAEQHCNLADWFRCLSEHTTCSPDAMGPQIDIEPCAEFSCE